MTEPEEGAKGPTTEDSESEQRIRKLTVPAAEIFEKKCTFYYQNINATIKTIDELLTKDELNEQEKTELKRNFDSFDEQFNIFIHYLERKRTEKSLQEALTIQLMHDKYSYYVKRALEDKMDDKKSVRSHRSYTSRKSDISETKAKLERLRISHSMIEKEHDLRREKAKIEEKEQHIKAEVLRQKLELEIELEKLAKEKELLQVETDLKDLEENDSVVEDFHEVKDVKPEIKADITKGQASATDYTMYSKLFLKMELLPHRLTKFSDKPEHFETWKQNFKNISEELELSPSEEYDLIIKHLGNESSKVAERIRAANARNPQVALEKLWQRLHTRFGMPELIEKALKDKLSKLIITNRDPGKLFELADLLEEIASYMEDPKYSALFGYFNSSVGVQSIVQKLPYHVQNKWMNHASRYKKEHDVVFPPFTTFVEFVKDASIMLNDPGLVLPPRPEKNSHEGNKHTSTPKQQGNFSVPYRVKKTEVEAQTYCPYHDRIGHNLNSCRTFKSMSHNQRKQFLRENSIASIAVTLTLIHSETVLLFDIVMTVEEMITRQQCTFSEKIHKNLGNKMSRINQGKLVELIINVHKFVAKAL